MEADVTAWSPMLPHGARCYRMEPEKRLRTGSMSHVYVAWKCAPHALRLSVRSWCILYPQLLEPSRLRFDGRFGGEPFHAGCAEEPNDAFRVVEDVLHIVRFGDGAAVA